MILTDGMKCAASKLEMDLMPDHSVRITLRCASAYEASVLYDDLTQRARGGSLVLDFGVTKISEQ